MAVQEPPVSSGSDTSDKSDTPAPAVEVADDAGICAALAGAAARGELALAYQPQLCLRSGQIVGAEALMRWHSPRLGTVSPARFIPLAESSGLIVGLGDWLIDEVCAQLQRWRAQALPPLRVALNLAPAQFSHGDLGAAVRAALARHGVEPSLLALEFTEAALVAGSPANSAALRALQREGVQLVLDDFGTGASSLRSLRSLPFSLVKIHDSFIRELPQDPDGLTVTRSIIHLAHALGYQVLAEGVETPGQLQMLHDEQCDQMQGYLYSPPVAPEAFVRLLREGRRLAPPRAVEAPQQIRTLLLVDDEQHIQSALKRLFRRDGYRVLTASGGPEALELLATHAVDVIVSDQRMPGMLGTDLLRRVRTLYPQTIRITLSGYTDLQSIIDAVNEGAVYKFLTKPWDDELLRAHVAEAFAQKTLVDDNRRLQAQLAGATAEQQALSRRLGELIGQGGGADE
jgi:EAL domain-containing protein (putative c-di-GMP-specific phosphodiesterase class I)/FixJ family two-component response regulator